MCRTTTSSRSTTPPRSTSRASRLGVLRRTGIAPARKPARRFVRAALRAAASRSSASPPPNERHGKRESRIVSTPDTRQRRHHAAHRRHVRRHRVRPSKSQRPIRGPTRKAIDRLAHPDFRERLEREAHEKKLIPELLLKGGAKRRPPPIAAPATAIAAGAPAARYTAGDGPLDDPGRRPRALCGGDAPRSSRTPARAAASAVDRRRRAPQPQSRADDSSRARTTLPIPFAPAAREQRLARASPTAASSARCATRGMSGTRHRRSSPRTEFLERLAALTPRHAHQFALIPMAYWPRSLCGRRYWHSGRSGS